MIEIACVAVVGVTLYCISTEGAWGAANAFLCVLIAALMAMNYFEPLADFLEGRIGYHYKNYTDVVALLGLFIGLTFGLRLGSESLAPLYIRLPAIVDQLGKWTFGALTGYLTMAFLLMALHTAPLPREFLGFLPPSRCLDLGEERYARIPQKFVRLWCESQFESHWAFCTRLGPQW